LDKNCNIKSNSQIVHLKNKAMRLIIFILCLLFSIEAKTQGGVVSIPLNLQKEIYDYISNVDINAHESRLTPLNEGNIFTWQIPLDVNMTKKISVHSPEKLVEDENLSSRVNITYEHKSKEVDIVLWLRDKDGDIFGSIIYVSRRQKNSLIKKADLSGFEERFKKN
jgi:hypothetical protein